METKTCKLCGRVLAVENFWRNKYGYSCTCKECASKKRNETRNNKREMGKKDHEKELIEARRLRLQEFTPRELIARLA